MALEKIPFHSHKVTKMSILQVIALIPWHTGIGRGNILDVSEPPALDQMEHAASQLWQTPVVKYFNQ